MSKLGNTDNLSSNQENVVLSGVKDQWPLVCHVAEWRRVAVITHRTPADGANIHNQGWIFCPEIIYFSAYSKTVFLLLTIIKVLNESLFHSKSLGIVFFLVNVLLIVPTRSPITQGSICSPSLHSALLSAGAPLVLVLGAGHSRVSVLLCCIPHQRTQELETNFREV